MNKEVGVNDFIKQTRTQALFSMTSDNEFFRTDENNRMESGSIVSPDQQMGLVQQNSIFSRGFGSFCRPVSFEYEMRGENPDSPLLRNHDSA